MGQGQSKGPDPLQGDDSDLPARLFGKEISDEERRDLITKAYEQLKTSFKKFIKPDGTKEAPAKTCKDLAFAHPDLPSGTFKFQKPCDSYSDMVHNNYEKIKSIGSLKGESHQSFLIALNPKLTILLTRI